MALGSYDASLVSGLMQELVMALTGACPETVLVQLVRVTRVHGGSHQVEY